jgi:hypothetical protein
MVTAAGEVKVLDFGTAHANFDDREAKTMALAFGSQAYMAPERVIGDPDAPSSDIFSLGITFYEALTLERFGPIHVRESKYRKRLEEIIPVMRFGELPSGLAEEVEAFFRRMLEFDAELRPTAAEVVDTMEEFGERAEDMGLRRFCKAIVPEAIQTHVYDALPGDPLTGTTVYEDASSAFGTLPNTVSEPRQRQVAVPEVSDPFAVPPELDDEPVAGEPGPEHARPRLGGTSTLPGPFGEFMPMEVIEPQVATPTIVGLLPEADALVPEVDAPWAPPEEPEEGSVFAAPEELAAAADEQEPEVEWPSTEEPPVSSPPLTPPAPPTPLVVSDPFKQPSEDVPPLEANASAWTEAPLPPPQSPVDGPEPAREIQPWPPALESASPVDPPPTAQARGPSRLVMVVAGLLGALVVIAGGGFAVYKTMDQGSGPSPDVKPDEGANAEPNSTGRPARPGEGGNLLLLMDPPGAASVSITSLLGFRHEWDGLGKLELNDIPNGAYKTRINPKKGTSIRSTVEVAAGQTCTYKYIVSTAKDEWEKLGCQ